jgi:flavin reductase (DIM6/NTAB) family NADH-FMN oxidoreductase RutF
MFHAGGSTGQRGNASGTTIITFHTEFHPMDKISISPNFFIPMPVVLVGTQVNGRPNFMPVGWCSRANANPPMISCAIAKMHHTPKGIVDTRIFSVNVPSCSLMEKVDYCGLVSGADVDKSEVFDVWYGTLGTAPMIRECPVTMECMLVHAVELPTNTVFIGEITGAYADITVIKAGRPDFAAINPLLLTMPDNTYHTLGGPSGKAWRAGMKLKQK